MGMGMRPIRDIALPDVREDFAAQLRLARLLAGHDPLAGADDYHAQAAEHARDVGLGGVDAQAGLADALQAADDGHLADVLEADLERALVAVAGLLDVVDEALLLEDAGNGQL